MEITTLFRGIICLVALVIPFYASAQKVIDYPPKLVIVCMDGDTRKCMGGVKVTFWKGDSLVKTVTTDGCGRCLVLKPKQGNYYISASKPGYLPFTLSHIAVPAEQTIVLEVPLESDPNSKLAKKPNHLVAVAADLIPAGNY